MKDNIIRSKSFAFAVRIDKANNNYNQNGKENH